MWRERWRGTSDKRANSGALNSMMGVSVPILTVLYSMCTVEETLELRTRTTPFYDPNTTLSTSEIRTPHYSVLVRT